MCCPVYENNVIVWIGLNWFLEDFFHFFLFLFYFSFFYSPFFFFSSDKSSFFVEPLDSSYGF